MPMKPSIDWQIRNSGTVKALRAKVARLKADIAALRRQDFDLRERLVRVKVERDEALWNQRACPACEQDVSLCCPEHIVAYIERVVRERDRYREALSVLCEAIERWQAIMATRNMGADKRAATEDLNRSYQISRAALDREDA